MSLFRRFQAPVIAVLFALLATPAVAACCIWTAEPMACCEKSGEEGLTSRCCLNQADQSQRQIPASVAELSRQHTGLFAVSIAQPVDSMAADRVDPRLDQPTGPPGSHPLYLRLSVIRR